MKMSRLFGALAMLLLLAFVAPAQAKDWFVKAEASGDGTRDKPFGDPYEALEKCEAGDTINIAEGRYTGKLESGEWKIPFDGVKLIGGFSGDWSQRDPWKFRTMLVWDKNSKSSPEDERITATVKDVTLDGLFIDESEQNGYADAQGSGRTPNSLDKSTAAVRFALPGTVRNCVFVNTNRQAVVCPNGSTIENNLFLNVFDSGVTINSLPPQAEGAKTPAIVKGNTFLWSWDDRAAGKGRYSGAGLTLGGPATVTDNIFGHCDNNAIYQTNGASRTTIKNNVFFMNLFSNYKSSVDGTDVVVDDKTMDLLEEAGLKATGGNAVKNPRMPLDKGWMEGTLKRTAGEQSKVVMDDWNKYRQAMGLDLRGTGGKAASGIAPLYPVDKVLALMTPKDASVTAGARIVKLEAKFGPAEAAGPAKTYDRKELLAWVKDPAAVEGKPLEMVCAMSSVANVSGLPAPYKVDDYEGIFLHDQNGEERIVGFYKKGTAVNRAVNEGAGYYNGSGKADRLYTVKGMPVTLKGVPKIGFLIESIAPFEAGAVAAKHIVGQDWFVRAGATGGDGTKEKPFRDPYQALEKCEAGDVIHVAQGKYVGKLRAGHWVIDCPDITMLGGYNDDFTARDPWKNITLLYCPADYKGTRGGVTLQGTEDHSRFVLDGFLFDKKLNNKYSDTGDLMHDESDKTEHVVLSRPGCAVRNCVFMNGAAAAVRLASAQIIENNIFFNQAGQEVVIEGAFDAEIPVIFKNNTLAFAWEKRFGQGHGITADLLTLGTGVRAIVDNNIFEFADQHALRLSDDPKDVELTNNVFAQNLWADVMENKNDMFVDNKNFAELKQLGWKQCAGNAEMTPGLPLDQKWFDVYMNRTAYVPGKVQMDDWNQMREIMGEPMIATGGKAGEGYAPAYDEAKAMALFPKNPKCAAGARPVHLEVKFEGATRKPEQHEYQQVKWEDVQSADNWAKLDGKRIMLTVAIKSAAGSPAWPLQDVQQERYSCWDVAGPKGIDSGGFPIHAYALVGTRVERMFKQAKGYSNGAIEETHVVKGIVRTPRMLVVEAIEKADD